MYVVYMSRFIFIFGSIFIFLCFIVHHTLPHTKTKENNNSPLSKRVADWGEDGRAFNYGIVWGHNRPRSICFAAQGGNYTKSRPVGRWVELWRQPRVSLILFFLVTFRYFVSEMVLTCAVSIYIICKYGNGEIFTQSEEENGSRHL